MKFKKFGKRLGKRICAMAMAFSMVLTGFAVDGQVAFAKTEDEAAKQESVAVNSQSETPYLIEDEEATGVYYNSNSEMRDFRDETIYFVMTTRFYDGDSSNNVHCWDDNKAGNPDSDPAWRGDFKGLIEKLDYIKALGFTAIWLTPVVENASGYDYHGYHAINFSKVDPRYESTGCTYQDLIDAAHAKGMKVVQDVVFNHTGNWGEGNLYPIASKDYSQDLSDCEKSMVIDKKYGWDSVFNQDYATLQPTPQFNVREKLIMDGQYDTDNIYHHNGYIKGWETYDEQITSIAGDCMDLNTENPKVYHYIVDAYSKYIEMGVDAFRVDTVKHLSRLTYNKALISQLNEAYNKTHGTTGEGNFYMFGEVCTRVRDVWNRDIPALSCPFYTWKESKEYAWDDSETDTATATNAASVKQAYEDNQSKHNEPTSNNALLNGNDYHATDYSKASGLNVIDFPMHWNFNSARDAFSVAVNNDQYYNDATFNVTYVDSHDYAPDGAPENQRYAGSQAQWAENLSLMFTFRGIPCIYYGSEVEFQKGKVIDPGPSKPLSETGRAYFGDYIEGNVDVIDFARYTNATGKIADTLNHPLSLHIQRLNRLRAAIPALRKGQYSTEGCSGEGMSFKRRYTDSQTDSFALITVSGNATFSGIPNGKYTDAITGDIQNVTGGTLSTSGVKGQGDLRVYVLDTELTQAPGEIEGRSIYLSGGRDVLVDITPATSVALDKSSASLDLGETATFTASVQPSNASQNVSWKSSDNTVATVSGGKVTAKGEGTATITATTGNGLKAEATVTVTAKGVKVESVTLNKTSETLEAGQTLKLIATINPENAEPKYAALTWKSSDAKVASVDQSGLVTAIKKGTATITAETASGKSASMTVTVNGAAVYGNAIYFEKPSDWGNTIKAYFWEGAGTWKNAEWPGVAMEDMGDGVYSLAWPDGKEDASLKVIFNDGSSQTDDLDAKLNGYYKKDGWVKTVEPTKPPITITIDISLAESTAKYTYNGKEQKPAVVVKANDKTLTENTDYTVTYQNNVNAAAKTAGAKAPSIVIKGKGDYATKIDDTIPFTIEPKTLTNDNVTIAEGSYTYTGAEFTPKVTVSDTEAAVTADDYTVAYSDNINAGTATATVTGTGNYTGTVKKTFTIDKADTPANPPTDRVVPANTKLSEISLGGNWSWSDTDQDKSAAPDAKLTVTAVYTGADKDNYKNLSVTLVVTGSKGDCSHSETELVGSKAATCTKSGYTGDKVCKECGATVETGESIAASHKWDAGVVTKEPTETAQGSKQYTCTVCGEKKIELIPELAHTVHKWDNGKVTKEPTETAEGEMTYTCTICGETKTEVIPKTTHQHVWDSGEVTKEATAQEEGEKTYKCTGCSETKTETIPKLTQCQHEWNDGEVTKTPTVKEPGIKTYMCNKCGATKTETIPVLTCIHKWNTGHITIQPTETEEGEKEYTCTECGTTKVEKLPKKECQHTWNAGVVTKDPTEHTDGVKTFTCSICGATKTEIIPATGENGNEPAEKPTEATTAATTEKSTEKTTEATTEKSTEKATTEKPAEVKTEKTGVIDTKGKPVDEGDIIKDQTAAATYRVTNSGSTAKTVEYMIAGSKEKEVKVPDKVVINNVEYKVTSVAENAFKNKKTMEKVVIGANVKTIGTNAFTGCKNLKNVAMSGQVTTIGNKAFYKCTSLTSVQIPSKVSKIGNQAFYGCKNLKSITIQTTKLTDKKVGSRAFKGISSKATIKVPKTKLSQYKKLLKKKGVSTKVTIKK